MHLRIIVFSVAVLIAPAISSRADVPPEHIEFFETKVRPLLAKRCYKCHSAKSKDVKGGLRLDARKLLLKGGDSGAAVVPGKPNDSLLLKAVRYQTSEMPPDGKLKDAEIAALAKWVELGAPWPDEKAMAVTQKKTYDWKNIRKQHWAWKPVVTPPLPNVKDAGWIHNSIDTFVLAKLEAAGLHPVHPVAPRILLRRMYLDLIGLPPTQAQSQRFLEEVAKDRKAAISNVIDQLLESSHYGERWARHWLDVARYNDGFGGYLDNAAMPKAWHYRDWVIAAFNNDMPYDEFVRLQIAGSEDHSHSPATGFFALGPTYRSDGADPDSVAQARGETLDDRVDTLSRAFLALTVSCSKCHDHKFDPIPQQDYYSIAGVFNNTRLAEFPLVSSDTVKTYNDAQKVISDKQNSVNTLRNKANREKRKLSAEEQKQIDQWNRELDALRKTAPPKYDFAHILVDSGDTDMNVALRGNLRKPGELAPRRFLRLIAGESPKQFKDGSGRVELAEAIVDPQNPLTARVIVNRIWMHHFGKAFVRSPSNFGSLGQKPTHPELLDWLAGRFVFRGGPIPSDPAKNGLGWSIKSLHRLIMQSATYQLSTQIDAAKFEADGDNKLIWRMNPRRLDVESWRDALLSVTGELETAIGGPPVENIMNSRRRTLYAKVSRNGDRFASEEFLRLFDFPMMRATVPKRLGSIVPQQFLFLMNSRFMADRAIAFAKRLEAESKPGSQRISLAYQLLFNREPTAREAELGKTFLETKTEDKKGLTPMQQYAQVLLSSNEFMYLR